MFIQMTPFSYAQMLPAEFVPPEAPTIIEAPKLDIGSRCTTDTGTTPGVIEYYFCEDGSCKTTNTITCLSGQYCKTVGGNALCETAAETTTEFPDDVELPTTVGEKPVVSTPEIEPEPVTVDTPEPEKSDTPEGIELPDIEMLGIDPTETINPDTNEIIVKDKEEDSCPGCELEESVNKGFKTIVGFDPSETTNAMEQASLAMTNNFAQNAGTTIALGLSYPFAIAGGLIADVVTGIPITVIKVFGGDAEYVGATKKIHNGWTDGFKKAWKAIWG